MNGASSVGVNSPCTQTIQQKPVVSDEVFEAILKVAAMPTDSEVQSLLNNVVLASEAVGRSIDRLA